MISGRSTKLAKLIAASAAFVLASALAGCAVGHAAQTTVPPAAAAVAVSTPYAWQSRSQSTSPRIAWAREKKSGLDVMFVVTHLRTGNGWAWVEAEPQSAGGGQRYETTSGLLHLEKGRWCFVEGLPGTAVCEENPDCADPRRCIRALA